MMVESSVDESPEKEGRGLKGQSEEGDRKKGHWDPPYPGRAPQTGPEFCSRIIKRSDT